MADSALSATRGRVPCTIITGFLGAGKTTLIRNLLEQTGGSRLAIVVNEFGDVGIDGEILRSCGVENCPQDNIVELANGCICCTVADDFAPALDRILALEPKVDHILIETSGLALPKPLVQAFQWPAIRGRVTVDGVIAVVDGPALAEGRVAADPAALETQRAADASIDHDDPVEEVFEDQIACADLVIVSKTDLLGEADRARVEETLRPHLPPAVRIVAGVNGKVDAAVALGLGLGVEDDIENRRTHHDDEADHEHDEFDSFVVELPAVARPEDLARRISAAVEAENILRLKGFAHVEGKPLRLLVQAAGPRVDHYFDRPWSADETPRTRLVVIGLKGIDRAAIERILAA
ncbi:cobalamin biosynthesis protein CobW [Pseudochelatococcus lubricantis]|uniref:Cobalamin biosynthesis protein CobW n=1 Tax=Pseudochelatococcus lubricantis TaxID=1538102 RepID=A0ABX0UY74_9HYPH|nr:cobalamin biosynthesis protein CobW [Pseudochelatococcus lubricantis]NIJ57886.1 cobalamin biosynthesis protein CobW [Pseudochelatococcus lubricantis]